ncbi:hypothetical protein CQW23_14211 [Capsicum baccatum]|uniref:Replication factor A C-terminal domain-containing protein n=1 Tax=Capsicum baccatum TaxID=33114 RepID=A0A2G2WIJ4_CAPBA|nr:hypothetical protein CQW23_14211 [Capsicum baccatum]
MASGEIGSGRRSIGERYKLQVRVMDGTGFISLLLWDRNATKLIGKSATQLKGRVEETTDSDDDGAYPVVLNTILDKNALFKDSNPDNDLNTPTNTQSKRSLLEVESLSIEVEDDLNTQLSSTKLNKVVKKEKLA